MAKLDPYAVYADPVDAPRSAPAPDQAPAAHGSVAVENDPYAAVADPVGPQDATGANGYGDQNAIMPSRQLSPEDEAMHQQLLRTGTAHDVLSFLEHRGFRSDPVEMDKFMAARDKAAQIGAPIDFATRYEAIKPVETDAPGAVGRGVMDTVSMGTLPKVGAVIAGAESALKGDGFSDAYYHQLDENNAVVGADEQDHPWMRLSGQLLGGLAIPTGLEGVGLKAGSEVLRAGGTMGEARAAAAIAVTRRSAAMGGAFGAAHGAGSADNLSDAARGAVIEGGLGVAGGALLAKTGQVLAPHIASATRPVLTGGQEVMQAADRQGLDVLPADVGGPITRGMTAATAQTPLGVVPIAQAANQLDRQAEGRIGAIAGDLGSPAADTEGLGTIATEGALKYASAAKRAGGRLYDAAAARAGDTTIDLKNARGVLDQQIARLQAVPGGGAGLKEAQDLRATLDKPYPVQGVRDMRTENFVSPDFRGTPVEARMKAVTNAAADDIVEGLRAQGKGEAADMFRAADEHWRGTLVNLKRNIEPIIGKLDNLRSPEAVATALNSAMKNNGARVGSFINSLPDEQQGVVRASMLSPLGRDKDGLFSIARFATDWNALSPAAKKAVFGAESRAALDDLATVGGATKQAAKYANHSNTARAVIADRMLGTLGTGATIGIGLHTFGAALAGQYGVGRLLASPRFARWLARAPRTALSAPAYIDRLTRIARAEPAIANEVLSLQQRLASAFTSQSPPLAAQDVDNGGQPPEQK